MSDLTSIAGIGPVSAKTLAGHGITSVAALAAATLEQLTAIPGFSEARAKTVIVAAKTSAASMGTPAPVRAARKSVRKKSTTANKQGAIRKATGQAAAAEGKSSKEKKQKTQKKDKTSKRDKSKGKKLNKPAKNKKQAKGKKGKKK